MENQEGKRKACVAGPSMSFVGTANQIREDITHFRGNQGQVTLLQRENTAYGKPSRYDQRAWEAQLQTNLIPTVDQFKCGKRGDDPYNSVTEGP